jgi:hypothetical protein
MAYSRKELRDIYERTHGRCHVCGSKRAFTNYGVTQARGAWHVDHSVPVANGGTDRRNNLYVACIGCNCAKGAKSTRSARRQYGRAAAPLSKSAQKESDFWSAFGSLALAVGGALIIGAVVKGRSPATPPAVAPPRFPVL